MQDDKLRLLLVADYIFYQDSNGAWYSDVPWWNSKDWQILFNSRLERIQILSFGEEKCKASRELYNIGDLFEIVDVGKYSTNPFKLISQIRKNRHLIKQLVDRSDVVWLKLFSFNSVYIFKNYIPRNKITVAQLVGDSERAFLDRPDIIKSGVLRKFMAKLVKKELVSILRKATIASTVSFELKNKYIPSRPDTVVADESRLKDWMYAFDKELERKAKKILFVGSLTYRKGILDLIKAFKNLVQQIDNNVELHIVGDGSLLNESKELCSSLKIDGKVTFHGWMKAGSKELIEMYRNADIFVLPSYAEGLPIVVLEAMANKCAVVATAVNGTPEIVRHEETGLLVKPGDIEGLVAAIKRFIEDFELRRKCVENAFKEALERSYFKSRGKLANKILEVWESKKRTYCGG